MKRKLKLYVWEDVLTDYTSGVMFALAYSVGQARKVILASQGLDKNGLSPWRVSVGQVWEDLQAEPKIIRHPQGFAVWGGG